MVPANHGNGIKATLREKTRSMFRKNSFSQDTWIALGILILTLAAYLQVIGFQFVTFDDPLYITRNPTIQSGLNWKSLHYAFTTGDDGSYLPLVWLSHAACVSIFKEWAGGHHLVSLLLHVANSVLLFYFLKRLTKARWPSATVAFLFALHPLHVESVAWVSERKDVLSTFFWILTSWAYVRYVERPSTPRYLGMVLLFALGLLSKSMLVTLPITLLLFDMWPLRRVDWTGVSRFARAKAFWALIAEKTPLFVLSLGAAVATFIIQRNLGAMVTLGNLPIHLRIGNALIATATYLQQTVWPVGLSAFYPYTHTVFPVGWVAGSSALLLGITVICALNLRRRPYLAVGWCWYLITLLPVVGIVQVGSQAHADRYTYIPLIGIFLMMACLAEEFIGRWRLSRRLVLVTSASLLGILLTLTGAQAFVWRDNLTLFANAFSLDTKNPVALLNIGDEYLKRDQYQNAHAAYSKGLEVSAGLYLSHFKVGYALELMGRPLEALPCYWKAKQLKPDLLSADQRIGQVLTRMGRFDAAEPFVKKVMAADLTGRSWDPVDPQASLLDWAIILSARNHLPEALQVLEAAVGKFPKSAQVRVVLGMTLCSMGRNEEGLLQIEKAVELSPKNAGGYYYLGSMLTQLGRFTEARRVFDRLKELDSQSPWLQRGLLELEKAQTVTEPSGSQKKNPTRSPVRITPPGKGVFAS